MPHKKTLKKTRSKPAKKKIKTRSRPVTCGLIYDFRLQKPRQITQSDIEVIQAEPHMCWMLIAGCDVRYLQDKAAETVPSKLDFERLRAMVESSDLVDKIMSFVRTRTDENDPHVYRSRLRAIIAKLGS
jgi:hypothetical protein